MKYNEGTVAAAEAIASGESVSQDSLQDAELQVEALLFRAFQADSPADAENALQQALDIDGDHELALQGRAWLQGVKELAQHVAREVELHRLEEEQQAEQAEKERLEQEEFERMEREEREEQERLEREEQERLEREEQERLEREEQERLEREEQERLEREEQERREEEEVKQELEATEGAIVGDEEGSSLEAKPVVLSVDDSPTIRKLVSMTLSLNGYEVIMAEDGVAALNLLSEITPDLILSDINMPRLDGYKLCKFVKKHKDTKHIPVLLLSGKDGVFDQMRGKMSGCDGYLTKPFESAELLEQVRKYLGAKV